MRTGVVGNSLWLRLLFRAVPIVAVALGLGGCFAPRTHLDTLDAHELPVAMTALLPVSPGQVILQPYISSYPSSAGEYNALLKSMAKEYEDVVHVVNNVLDTLAGGGRNPLQGPAKLRLHLGDDLARLTEKFNAYMDDPGPPGEQWKNVGLAELASSLGTDRVVRVKVAVEGKLVHSEDRDSGVIYSGWDGEINCTAELWGLVPARLRATGSGTAQFWGKIGIIGGQQAAVPFAIGKTFGRAVNQAVREALARLFRAEAAEGIGK
jgi:hypothetical protein